MRMGLCGVLVALWAALALGQEIPNPSFEAGDAAPTGWRASGKAAWLAEGAADGQRAIAASGDGKASSQWRTDDLPFRPGGLYRISFRARSINASGGTPITGPAFCNRDLGKIPSQWQAYHSIFAVPDVLAKGEAYVRFGQWEVNGTIAFDAVRLEEALPIHSRFEDVMLGEGESIQENEYAFEAPYSSASRNHSRALASHTAAFNTDRWVFSRNSEVVYRHQVAGRAQSGAQATVSVTWHNAGECRVEASVDGREWRPLGTIGGLQTRTFDIPAGMLPAAAVWIRMKADDSHPSPSFQVGQYGYRAKLSGAPITAVGATRFLAVERNDPSLAISGIDLGEALPGGRNRFVATLRNSGPGRKIRWSFSVGAAAAKAQEAELKSGENTLQCDYGVPGAGTNPMRLEIAGTYLATGELPVAELHAADYGEVLRSDESASVWWASSGWKVSRTRPEPAAQGEALVIRAARNEAEAAQLVVRPSRAIKGLTVEASELTNAAGGTIARDRIDLLRVRYVMVTQPTDATSCVAPWPDPLPPFAAPIDLEAGRNQPLWVRVNVPRDAKPGTYAGTVRLSAEGWSQQVPIRVEVYNFEMPDRMTCVTAFGFSASNVWRYQKLAGAADRRAVFDKYMANLSAHHISPYEPAPFDAIKVDWGDKASPKPVLDFAAWDRAMTRAIDVYHFNSFMLHIPGMGGGTFHERVDPELLGHKENTPQYQAAFDGYCKAVQAHLREKGWLDEAFIYWFDEPDPKDYEFVNNGFRKLKSAAPGLNRMLTEQVEEKLIGGPNIWCPVTPEYNHDAAEARRQHGEMFWWYVCTGPKAPYCTLFIDHPATEMRVWLWQTWQRKIDGILVWQTNYWTSDTAYPDRARPQNPYEDPMGWTSGYSTPTGARRPWGNGDGRFIYPPESAADASPGAPVLDGPVDSIRWEMLRDGIEDYEYLAILKRLLAERSERLKPGDRARYAALLEVPADVTADMTHFTRSPQPIESRRDAVARAIVELLTSR